ncbi:DUF2637 domain-containing protein [Plantactinospora veratri]|uniref:DUF2637 domain-containing protein n=1 Tax=Plantactinospora veratri TaxID=1436122 RepID=A0ABU7SQ42_9ACTN
MNAAPMPATAAWHAGRRPAPQATISSLKRIRWSVRATLLLGVAASVAANILHAQPHLISQAIAAWPPIALLLTVELISRVPVHRQLLAAVRLTATTTIAGIAAWVSYWHMVGVAAHYGETGVSAYLLPLSVDGLVVVASISLVELSGRLHAAQSLSRPTQPASAPAPASQPAAGHQAAAPPADPPAAPAITAPPDERPAVPAKATDRAQTNQRDPAASDDPSPQDESTADPTSSHRSSPKSRDDGRQHGDDDTDAAPQRPPRGAATRKAVIDTYLRDPTMHPTAIAEEIGTSERTVRRYLDEFRTNTGTDSANGNRAERGYSGSPR